MDTVVRIVKGTLPPILIQHIACTLLTKADDLAVGVVSRCTRCTEGARIRPIDRPDFIGASNLPPTSVSMELGLCRRRRVTTLVVLHVPHRCVRSRHTHASARHNLRCTHRFVFNALSDGRSKVAEV